MNKFSKSVLAILSSDSRTSSATIATMLGVNATEVDKAIGDMEREGIIVKYSTIINEDKFEHTKVEALIEVKVSPMHTKGFDAIAEHIMQFAEVKSLYLMSGAYDLAVFIEGNSLRAVAGFVSEKLSAMDKVLSTATHFILKKYKVQGVSMDSEQNVRLVVHA